MNKMQEVVVELDYAGMGNVEFIYNRVEYFVFFSRQGNIVTCSIDAYKANSQHCTTIHYNIDTHSYSESNTKTDDRVIKYLADAIYNNYKGE